MSYREEITKAMNMLRDDGYTFIGQSVCYPGTAMYGTLKDVPMNQRIEMPVAEDFQLGFSTGQALQGMKVCSLFPRMDFLLCAMNQLINHLDKIEALSEGRFKPKVIIRTSVGGKKQLDPGLQHVGDYYKELKTMCTNIDIHYLNCADIIYFSYLKALESNRSSILIELGDCYD